MKFFYIKIGLLAVLTFGTILYSSEYLTLTAIKSNTVQTNHTMAQKVYNQSVPSVFAIYFDSKEKNTGVSGTGFAISHQNELIIVTNEHVVPYKNQDYFLVANNQKKYKAKLIYSNKEDDIAFLKLTKESDIPPLKLDAKVSRSSIGEPVFTIGNPYDFLFSYNDGLISNIDKQVLFENGDYDEELIQTNIDVNPGNSGGPLLNRNGEAIGIISSILDESSGMSFAVPADIIIKHLEYLNKASYPL